MGIFFSLRYKGKKKKDEGFAYNYFKLSYRRKFIRTLNTSWMSILAIILIFTISPYSMVVNVLVAVGIILLSVGQALYNYYMWKKHEDENPAEE